MELKIQNMMIGALKLGQKVQNNSESEYDR